MDRDDSVAYASLSDSKELELDRPGDP